MTDGLFVVTLVDCMPVEPGLDDQIWSEASAEERHRAASFERPDLGERWLRGRLVARVTAAHQLGVTPGRVSVESARSGQPVVHLDGQLAAKIHLSLSRSRHWAAVAVAGCPVGIDIEHRVHLPEAESLALRHLHRSDAQHVVSARDPSAAFLSSWVGLEAVLKRRGTGFDGSQPPPVRNDASTTLVPGLPPSLIGALSIEHAGEDLRDPRSKQILAELVRVQTIDEMSGLIC